MATIKFAGKFSDGVTNIIGAWVSNITISGFVTLQDAPVERVILGYNTKNSDKSFVTSSDPITGKYTLKILANPGEKVRIICVGGQDENSIIYDWIGQDGSTAYTLPALDAVNFDFVGEKYFSPSDDFTGDDADSPNTIRWNQYSDDFDSGDDSSVMDIDNNRLDFSISDAKTFPVTQSNFKLSGDFDIQVDFGYDSTPGAAAYTAGLAVGTDTDDILSDTNYAWIGLASLASGGYRSNIIGSTIQNSGVFEYPGILRIVRSGTTLSTYYWHDDAWVLLNSDSVYTTADVYVKLFCRTWTTITVDGYFDNFTVNSADDVIWPISKTISGIVEELNIETGLYEFVERVVRVYDKESGELLGETTSDETDGTYSIDIMNVDEVFVVAFDDEDGTSYNAKIYDKITFS